MLFNALLFLSLELKSEKNTRGQKYEYKSYDSRHSRTNFQLNDNSNKKNASTNYIVFSSLALDFICNASTVSLMLFVWFDNGVDGSGYHEKTYIFLSSNASNHALAPYTYALMARITTHPYWFIFASPADECVFFKFHCNWAIAMEQHASDWNSKRKNVHMLNAQTK